MTRREKRAEKFFGGRSFKQQAAFERILARKEAMSNQELSIEELTERFYAVRGQRNGLIAVIQKIRPFIYAFQRGEASADTSIRAIETLCNEAVKVIHPEEQNGNP